MFIIPLHPKRLPLAFFLLIFFVSELILRGRSISFQSEKKKKKRKEKKKNKRNRKHIGLRSGKKKAKQSEFKFHSYNHRGGVELYWKGGAGSNEITGLKGTKDRGLIQNSSLSQEHGIPRS